MTEQLRSGHCLQALRWPVSTTNGCGRDLKEALLDAAEEVGEVEETEILDKDGNSTGQFSRKATGKGGLKGYLKWAAVHRANAFIPQLGRIMPMQVNVKTDIKPKRVPYRSYAEICDALRAKGIDPEVMERGDDAEVHH
jgi:hypothetical protein